MTSIIHIYPRKTGNPLSTISTMPIYVETPRGVVVKAAIAQPLLQSRSKRLALISRYES